MKNPSTIYPGLVGILAGLCSFSAFAESDEELAKKALNPVAAMISLPIQVNYDSDIGPAKEGTKTLINIQPVIPFSMNEDWNLISRTILPLVDQKNVTPTSGSQSGVGDIVQSVFFSPKKTTANGWILGAGPVLLLPSGSNEFSAKKWGAGPTIVALKQDSGWTYGVLANHLWSFAGDAERADISATFVQPFLSYTNKSYLTLGLNTESTYDWKSEKWLVPLNFTATQMLKIGGQPLTLTAGARYWASTPKGVGPEGWGFRLALTLLFPK
ncbi:transporter [Undibacterium sp. Ren11W]|uniref:transporter n=1 Tax=Undibacterium sp. Ren11W TaxID=3413045 RepID=UPI003BF0B4E0